MLGLHSSYASLNKLPKCQSFLKASMHGLFFVFTFRTTLFANTVTTHYRSEMRLNGPNLLR